MNALAFFLTFAPRLTFGFLAVHNLIAAHTPMQHVRTFGWISRAVDCTDCAHHDYRHPLVVRASHVHL